MFFFTYFFPPLEASAIISATVPAPIVLPPSRTAKRKPLSKAIGLRDQLDLQLNVSRALHHHLHAVRQAALTPIRHAGGAEVELWTQA